MYEDTIRHNAFHAALFAAPETPVAQVRGFGKTDADAMQNAVESGRVAWDIEEGAAWHEIAADARRAAILTFKRTPYGVLVLDEN